MKLGKQHFASKASKDWDFPISRDPVPSPSEELGLQPDAWRDASTAIPPPRVKQMKPEQQQ